MKEIVLEEYSKSQFVNEGDSPKINKIISVKYGNKFFILEILLGLIVIALYLLLFMFNVILVFSWGALGVMLLIELFLILSALKKNKTKCFVMDEHGVKKGNKFINWTEVISVKRLLLMHSGTANSKMELVRIVSLDNSLDLELLELNYDKTEVINDILKFWSCNNPPRLPIFF